MDQINFMKNSSQAKIIKLNLQTIQYMSPVLVATGILGFLFNLSVCSMVFTNQRLQKQPLNRLIANLSLSDLSISMILVMRHFFSILSQAKKAETSSIINTQELHSVTCKVAVFMWTSSIFSATMTLAVISVERYKAIMNPFINSFSRKKTTISIIIVWVLAVTASSIFVVLHNYDDSLPYECTTIFTKNNIKSMAVTTILTTSICVVMPFIIVFACYTKIIFKIYRSKPPIDESIYRFQVLREFKRRNHSIIVLLIITILTMICYLPYTVLITFISSYKIQHQFYYISMPKVFWIVFRTAAVSIMTPCIVNPILYSFASTSFKEEVKVTFRKLLDSCHNESPNPSIPTLPSTRSASLIDRNINIKTINHQENQAEEKF